MHHGICDGGDVKTGAARPFCLLHQPSAVRIDVDAYAQLEAVAVLQKRFPLAG